LIDWIFFAAHKAIGYDVIREPEFWF
jgi:hypothetical protein